MIKLPGSRRQLGQITERMRVACERCSKTGIVEDQFYRGKRLRLRCPHCSHDFIFLVPLAATFEYAALGESENGILAVPQLPPGNEAAIREAKRIARLIVSEIKLYNHEKIEQARSPKEILDLLRTDLTRGKQHYVSWLAAGVPSNPDYFSETVKEILLAGKYQSTEER